MTLAKHLANNKTNIEKDAIEYARQYGMTLEKAREEVRDEYAQGWYESVEASRTTDWDFGRE